MYSTTLRQWPSVTEPFKTNCQSGDTTPGCTDTAAFIAPLAASPSNPLDVYVGTTRRWGSTNGGASGWTPLSPNLTLTTSSCYPDTISAIAVAPSSGQRDLTSGPAQASP